MSTIKPEKPVDPAVTPTTQNIPAESDQEPWHSPAIDGAFSDEPSASATNNAIWTINRCALYALAAFKPGDLSFSNFNRMDKAEQTNSFMRFQMQNMVAAALSLNPRFVDQNLLERVENELAEIARIYDSRYLAPTVPFRVVPHLARIVRFTQRMAGGGEPGQ